MAERGEESLGQASSLHPSDLGTGKLRLSRLQFRIKELASRVVYRSDWAIQFKFDEELSTSFQDFQAILPPLYTWWADPQLAYQDGKYYIFVEELTKALPRGHISVIEIDGNGRWKGPTRVLEKPYHMSYPFVFCSHGKFYMVPESAWNRTIDLYEAENFPFDWKLKKTIMSDVAAYDSTFLYKDGLWWLFCTIRKDKRSSASSELHIFYADDLFSDHWEPHVMNPVVSDLSSARPAGAIIEKSDDLLRPSQDCSIGYGYAININRIEELSEKRYKENRMSYLKPDWDKRISRIHTLNHVRGLSVIDTYLERFRW